MFFLPALLYMKVFFSRLCSDAAETVIHSADAFAPVGYLRFTDMHTESKDGVSETSEGIHGRNSFRE